MDYRTKRQKLEAMANQNVSPKEAAIARQKIAELDDANSRGTPFIIMGSGIVTDLRGFSFTAGYNFTATSFYHTAYPGNAYQTAFTRKATS